MRDDYLYELFRELGASDLVARTAEFFVGLVLILAGAMVVSRLGSRLARRSIESLVARSRLEPTARSTSRAKTLAGVAASLVRILVFSIAVLLILDTVGINLGPLLAGASIVGVALGFGAQSLVRDFLSGFFILAEDQYGVGDTVTVAEVLGTVEEVSLRTTRLRGVDGTVWYVPNGEIRKVGNSAKDWSRAIVDVHVPAQADINAATTVIREELRAIPPDVEWAGAILDGPEVLGVEAMGPDGWTVRVAARVAPEARGSVTRELRMRIAARLQNEGVVQVAKTPPNQAAAEPPAPEDQADRTSS
ncbi:MAG TPA: mechanosensitive ion channel family protein [Acidimicrobiales bacterium]|nr:mechanosensitive ion channel family protein [Acidimicrobiales bacterium]